MSGEFRRRALISVWDKTGATDLARGLVDLGFEILSTGGTYGTLESAGIPVTRVSDVTGFPEILDGRVKTLHPKIHGGILAMRTPEHLEELEAQGIQPVDLVVVNLYPFVQTITCAGCTWEDAVENIDIGGPTMVRAAAKNHLAVTVVVNPDRYPEILRMLSEGGGTTLEFRKELALEAFSHTAAYDAQISNYFRRTLKGDELPETLILAAEKSADLRYGENPHQKGAFYRTGREGLSGALQHQGKELSFNNLMDLGAAFEMGSALTEPAAVIVKHTNPCGAAVADTIGEAYRKAFAADPVSAFGSVISVNRTVDGPLAEAMLKNFVEALIAPGYTEEALEKFSAKKNLRILSADFSWDPAAQPDMRTVPGGILLQERDLPLWEGDLSWVVEDPSPEEILPDLTLAWTLVKHLKSNAIVTVAGGVTTGIGPGQTSRVGAARIALEAAGETARGGVLASDAFFPFRDTVDLAASYGIRAIIQPGGSVRDQESIEACREHGIALVFTGMRHFRH